MNSIKLGFLTIILLTINLLFIPQAIYAQSCCGTIPNNDCPVGQTCQSPSTLGLGTLICSPTQINHCVAATNTKPGFSLPTYNEIPELTRFNFKFLGHTTNIGYILSSLMPYIFALAGLLLFIYLIYGAFTILSAMGEAAKVASGSKVITRALIGFAILFVSYWIMELLEMVLGLNVI